MMSQIPSSSILYFLILYISASENVLQNILSMWLEVDLFFIGRISMQTTCNQYFALNC
jgi:hypothetical protein